MGAFSTSELAEYFGVGIEENQYWESKNEYYEDTWSNGPYKKFKSKLDSEDLPVSYKVLQELEEAYSYLSESDEYINKNILYDFGGFDEALKVFISQITDTKLKLSYKAA
jgi:hypothetical protein